MLFDALVLQGGRSSRLGETPKAELVFQGRTLLERTVAAVEAARAIAIVGPLPATPLPARVLVTREEPPFAGPAAGVAAGLAALASHAGGAAPHTVVLACDMPGVADVVERMLAALGSDEAASDGVICVDAGGMRQPLAAVYATHVLAGAVSSRLAEASLDGVSMRRLIAGLTLASVPVSGGTDDVDTWEDARRLGVSELSSRRNQ